MSQFFGRPWVRRLVAVLAGGAVTGVSVAAVVSVPASPPSSSSLSSTASPSPASTSASEDSQKQYSVKWDFNWDRRHPKEGEAKPKAVRHVIMVRHGQYNFCSTDDSQQYLTPLGREQLGLTGERLAQLQIPFSKLVCSTMTRAVESGKIISSHLPHVPVEFDEMIREGPPIRPEPPLRSWNPDDSEFFVNGARIEAAFRKHFHRAPVDQESASYELLVCHGNVIRYCVCRALQLPPEAWLRLGINHGAITWISMAPNGRVSLRSHGDCGFMPKEKLSS